MLRACDCASKSGVHTDVPYSACKVLEGEAPTKASGKNSQNNKGNIASSDVHCIQPLWGLRWSVVYRYVTLAVMCGVFNSLVYLQLNKNKDGKMYMNIKVTACVKLSHMILYGDTTLVEIRKTS